MDEENINVPTLAPLGGFFAGSAPPPCESVFVLRATSCSGRRRRGAERGKQTDEGRETTMRFPETFPCSGINRKSVHGALVPLHCAAPGASVARPRVKVRKKKRKEMGVACHGQTAISFPSSLSPTLPFSPFCCHRTTITYMSRFLARKCTLAFVSSFSFLLLVFLAFLSLCPVNFRPCRRGLGGACLSHTFTAAAPLRGSAFAAAPLFLKYTPPAALSMPDVCF